MMRKRHIGRCGRPVPGRSMTASVTVLQWQLLLRTQHGVRSEVSKIPGLALPISPSAHLHF
ncbi:hypothetical protein AGR3A_Lc180061 [Agrobacterium tomkonis CFBP 6623]|uniref:Uncharacterized protein n=1 Tax=Agrobacterium tomkonis CFBP 6623 TaxID=1183432 RepID=A0A1S7S1H2_9HYPH|nr:hypothetical protein AGR3A_Lc180061 [Agrobacterium tomkonis CFBP 6623]